MAIDVINSKNLPIKKIPPQNIEAEEALLGAILTNPMAIHKVADLISASSFYNPANKIIFEAMLVLLAKSLPIDIITVSNYLNEVDNLEKAGGRSYINDLAMNSVTSSNVEYYARIVEEKAIKRALISAGSEIVEMAYDEQPTENVLDMAEKRIFTIAQERTKNDLCSVSELIMPAYERIEHRFNNRDQMTGIPTGFYDFDKHTAGLQKSDLIILAARPAMGKTAFALNIAQNVALRAKEPVAIFSLEMSKEQLMQRLLCSEAEIDNSRVKTGNMQTNDWQKITEAMDLFTDAPLYIDDTPGATLVDIRAKCRRLVNEHKKLGLIVIDYLQLMEGSKSQDDRYQQISSISRGLKALARELNVPVIALSQLSRAIEQRKDRKPMLSDLRESGAIEQDADIVVFIHRDEYYEPEVVEHKGKAKIIIAKHRNGSVGDIDVLFQGNITKFKNKTNSQNPL